MWDGLFMLLGLSIVMAGASFFAGIVPLSVTLSPRQLRLLTALGTGVLVGTSLIVIIPEGVETLYTSSGGSHSSHARRNIQLSTRGAPSANIHFPSWHVLDARQIGTPGSTSPDPLDTTYIANADDEFHALDDPFPSEPPSFEPGDASDDQESYNPEEDDSSSADHDPHVWIGLSLILGFILMYLIDTLPQSASSALARPQRFPISLNQFSFNRSPSASYSDAPSEEPTSSPTSFRPTSTTVGLVIHAAADGIALGASSTSPTTNLSLIIFLALMLHKAPAAFGLTTVLLKQGLTKRQARLHLIVFSLAAPVGALATWLAIHLLGFATEGEGAGTEFATGVLLLFSGGTFLYVAMHTMQESGGHGQGGGAAHQGNGGMNGYARAGGEDPYAAMHGGGAQKTAAPAVVDTFVTVAGMLLPLLTQWGHVH